MTADISHDKHIYGPIIVYLYIHTQIHTFQMIVYSSFSHHHNYITVSYLTYPYFDKR